MAVSGFSSFHFCFAPSDKHTFCHLSLFSLDPAPHSPLDDNGSIAWSMCTSLYYINPMSSPSNSSWVYLGTSLVIQLLHWWHWRTQLSLPFTSPQPSPGSLPSGLQIASCITFHHRRMVQESHPLSSPEGDHPPNCLNAPRIHTTELSTKCSSSAPDISPNWSKRHGHWCTQLNPNWMKPLPPKLTLFHLQETKLFHQEPPSRRDPRLPHLQPWTH